MLSIEKEGRTQVFCNLLVLLNKDHLLNTSF